MSRPAGLGRALRAAVADITPLRESPPFRRLWAGQAVTMIGTQVTQVAVPLQIYELTRSSLHVGMVGLAGLLPLIVFGLYGGSIADAMDRRRLVLVTSTGTMLVSLVLLFQALAGTGSVPLLFACVAVQAAFAAVDSPTRRAIIPQLIAPAKLPAANTLTYGASQTAVIIGPTLAGVAIGAGGYHWAYGIDVATFVGAFYAAVRLPSLPPGAGATRAGLRSVAEGLRFIWVRPVVMMTFVADIVAMTFAMPRALFPAMAYELYGGGPRTAGLLHSAVAVGAVAATLFGGAIGRVRRQGLGVIVSVAAWGVAVTLFGLAPWLWVGLLMLAVAGAADTVSAVYRSTILQRSTPTGMQGRLQGVFMVVVAGGPRLGDLRAGAMTGLVSTQASVVLGGLACVASIGVLALLVPAFVRYDSRRVQPPTGSTP